MPINHTIFSVMNKSIISSTLLATPYPCQSLTIQISVLGIKQAIRGFCGQKQYGSQCRSPILELLSDSSHQLGLHQEQPRQEAQCSRQGISQRLTVNHHNKKIAGKREMVATCVLAFSKQCNFYWNLFPQILFLISPLAFLTSCQNISSCGPESVQACHMAASTFALGHL